MALIKNIPRLLAGSRQLHFQYDKDPAGEEEIQRLILIYCSSFTHLIVNDKNHLFQEFLQWRPACVAGHDAGEGEETQVEAQAQAARQTLDLSQEGGASGSRWERGL